MKMRHLVMIVLLTALWAVTASAERPVASPEVMLKGSHGSMPEVMDKAFGDPTDLLAAANAAADYIRYMQADITEDNAGNGDPDQDLEDAGWDWALAAFEHSAAASPSNLPGVIANSIFDVYDMTGDAALRTVLDDVAAYTLANDENLPYPQGLHYAGDMMFLLRYADLPGVANPADYRNKAVAIWNWRLNNTGTGTAVSVVEAIRNSRYSQNYRDGLIAWDESAYIQAVAMLGAAFPLSSYAADAVDMANSLHTDSFTPGSIYFDFDGRCKNNDDGTNRDYWYYSLGVAGLIQAFNATGTHAGDLPLLETRLMECQYPDGSFSDSWGATTLYDDSSWQATAYVNAAIMSSTAPSAAASAAAYAGGLWLAATQDVSGGFVYGNGDHYPEVGAECAMGLIAALQAGGAAVTTDVTFNDPAQCGAVGDVSFYFDRNAATPGLFGYEMIIEITGPVAPVGTGAFVQVAPMDYFRVDANLDGTFTVNSTRFGADPGLLVDDELFFIDNLVTNGEGTVVVNVLSYRMRDSQNAPIFVDMSGVSFAVDCTAPAAVDNIAAAPGHNKVQVSWTHDGLDTITYEIYRGLWYDTTVGNSAYPEYDDLAGSTIPTRPSNRAAAIASNEWEYAGTVTAGTFAFTDTGLDIFGYNPFAANGDDRGVYYYEVFAVDSALNGSAAAPANDRATNYWLGDVSPMDGLVDNFDMTVLGAAFATEDGDLAYNNAVDVGRTDDWSGKGIPLTDSLIDFEDLMVFALNYSVVGPAKSGVEISEMISLAWTQREDGRWALHLVGGSGLQGVHVRANLPAGTIGTVEAGELLSSLGETTFLINAGSSLDVNLAVMGRNVAFTGSGELFVVNSTADIKAADLSIELRATDNSSLEYTLDKLSGANTPMVFNLAANYPNPFNPMTKISFTLPATQAVKLAVYSLDGRRVATLLNETRGPGQHDVVWMGRDDAGHTVSSGTYFYRLDAGEYSQVRKMTLMK